ncbi:hypothetical protein Mucpa_4802 [Mucilaginibacter paludis DSM 18603]|uniref:Uncharacterized protein n=1 Tax=Mucilaginibacter paludis DSM 18603 TaxID=714943 RepID=H1Y369_9SPHI|nr:hypothetical protein Mucpa_4802 [Mucilaginibacter paludis DSM 18603]
MMLVIKNKPLLSVSEGFVAKQKRRSIFWYYYRQVKNKQFFQVNCLSKIFMKCFRDIALYL